MADNSYELPSYQEQVQEALVAMKSKLPEYVIESFVASGYDTLPIIAIVQCNTLTIIEDFVNSQYPGEARFYSSTAIPRCKFLPGHRILIMGFVREVNQHLSQQKKYKNKY